MKITPLEIRQKEFEKGFRGYDKDDVKAFLASLSQEWEREMDLQKELKLKLEGAEKEVEKLRQVESSLYKTLKTAEDTGANVVSQANRTAELHLKETQMKADKLLSVAQDKAKSIVEDANNKAQTILEEMEDELKEVAEGFKQLENHRDNVAEELKNLSNGLNDKVKKIEDRMQHVDIETHLKRARKAVKKIQNADEYELEEIKSKPISQEEAKAPNVEKTAKKEEPVKKETKEKKEDGGEDTSFFDEITAD
ncbi:DivIVA domain-containing protein [Marivirga harenae]|uniref:DivIVA domain-containing protein n=1 Tax=Marivirga harenae TaxID=2010992 RepID=UPI0026E021EF|nr:DivIVA domain-containing protein [Marivirga harenae]WKV11943.1 DivIVA domain-containing protein [Marivirga harenae]|tara:strand:- start:36270 stop:37025 length:756 start_codon:yes stop_codon:yes gene_type:complete